MHISGLLTQLLKVYFTGNKTIFIFKQIALVAYIIIWHYQYFLVVIIYIVCMYSILSIIVIARVCTPRGSPWVCRSHAFTGQYIQHITQWQKTKHRATHTLHELLSRKITEIYTITTKMASPTYSGVVALNERTLNSFTCFTWSTMIQYTWMHH